MQRRSFLSLLGATTVVTSTGCLDDDGAENVVLPPQEDQLGESDALAYPAYGQAFPEFTLPDPLNGETVESVDNDRVTIATAIYATCPAECLVLGNQLAGVQSELDDRGRSDEVRFIAVTFDPERDTEPVLRDYADMMGIDPDVGNWRFLRPEDEEEAEEIVTDRLGIGFEREGDEFIHPAVTFVVNPDGYVERAYQDDRPEIERVVGDIVGVADGYEV